VFTVRILSGWEDAFIDEHYSISQQLVLSEEEMRLLRADVKQKQDEILQLHLELEEAYIELDSLGKEETIV
jgi:hypothetical protein